MKKDRMGGIKMRRGWMLAAVVAVTAFLVWWMRMPETPVEAEIITVARGTVERVLPLTCRIGWLDTTILYSTASGTVGQVLHREGDRVAAGEALIRLDSPVAQAASAWVGQEGMERAAAGRLAEECVIRAHDNAVVRRILVEEGMPVASGTPSVVLSSSEQSLQCTATRSQAETLMPGMWARLYDEAGESLGLGYVTNVGDLQADETTGSLYSVITLTPEYRIQLPEGASVFADVYLEGRQDVPLLPVGAITDRDTVWWVNDEGTCTEIPAGIVLSDEMNAWVNLPEGLRVAVGEFEEGQLIAEVQP